MAAKKAAKKPAARAIGPGKHDHSMSRQAVSYLTNVTALDPDDRAAIQRELDRIDSASADYYAGRADS